MYNLFCLFFLLIFILFDFIHSLIVARCYIPCGQNYAVYNIMFYIGFWVYREPYVLLKRELHHLVWQMMTNLMVLSVHK